VQRRGVARLALACLLGAAAPLRAATPLSAVHVSPDTSVVLGADRPWRGLGRAKARAASWQRPWVEKWL